MPHFHIERMLLQHLNQETVDSFLNLFNKQQDLMENVVQLHKPVQGPYDNLVCDECSHMDVDIDFHTNYPCPTLKALKGEE